MSRSPPSYPHPVVGLRDDVSGEVLVDTPTILTEAGKVRVAFTDLRTTNETLRDLLAEGKAAFVARLECGSTMFRTSVSSSGPRLMLTLPADVLSGTVDVAVSLCATEGLGAYKPQGLNEDYGDATFVIEPGAVLGLGDQFQFDSENDFEPEARNVSSIMRVRPSQAEDEPLRVDYGVDLITITLSKADWRAYTMLRGSAPSVIHASTAFPVLAEAVRLIQQFDENEEGTEAAEYRSLKWFGRLTAMIESLDAPAGEEPFTIAARLLQHPLRRASVALEAVLSGDQE